MKRWPIALAVAAGVLMGTQAQGSVNLPLHHWAYEDIERLTALGAIDRAMVSAKPYSRKLAAKYVARALNRTEVQLDGREVVTAPLLARLVRELRPELVQLGVMERAAGEKPGLVRYGGRLQVELDQFRMSAMWWGTGYRGSLLVSDHALPLDMVRLGTEEPFRLPGALRGMGEWRIDTFLAELESSPDFPRTKVFGLRIGALPADWLELGFTRLTQFDWPGFKQKFPSAVMDAYTSGANRPGNREVNEQVMLDFRARVPKVPYLVPFPTGMQIYGEIGSEDKWSKWVPSRGAFVAGIYIAQLFAGDSVDLRIEYADTDFTRRNINSPGVWYNNGTYTTGMRERGFPLGHWIGTDATDLFVRATRQMTAQLQLGLHLDVAERGRGNAPVHETKREAAVDLTWWFSYATQLSVGYTRQRLKNPGQMISVSPAYVETFPGSATAINNLVWTRLVTEF